MIDYILTVLIPLALGMVVLWKSRAMDSQDFFMGKDYSTVLKGLCCIIVILVHVPLVHANKLQDAMGSFAYVCVTLFFLMSAYGMSLSAARKKDYMLHFWRNRLAALLVPQLIINAVNLIYDKLTIGGGYGSLCHINGYVLVLLEYCLWFYLVNLGRRLYNERTANSLLIGGVIVSSVLSYFLYSPSAKASWPFERWGLVWGVLLFAYFCRCKEIVKPSRKKITLLATACLVLGVAYLKYKTQFFWGEYLLKIVLGIAIITFLFTLSSKRTFGNKASFFLGEISYEVYLSHGFIMHVLDKTIPNMPSGTFVLTTVIVTIMFSAVIHNICKPIVKMIRAKKLLNWINQTKSFDFYKSIKNN